MSRALVVLAEHGVHAETEAKQQLSAAYHNFIEEAEPQWKDEAGRDLIRAIFERDSVAEDFSSLICHVAFGITCFREESTR